MELILLIVQLVVAILLIGFVLLQRSDNDGFGMGSGSGGGLMSSRGQANFMTKTTAILAFVFMANSMVLTILTTSDNSASLIDEITEEQPFQVPVDGAGESSLKLDPKGASAIAGEAKGVFKDATADAKDVTKTIVGGVENAVKGAGDVTVQPGAIEVSPQTVPQAQ